MTSIRPTASVCAIAALISGCGNPTAQHQVTMQTMADGIYTALAADRAVYTREVVNRLQDEENVIRASEHFRDDRALPLPAQMFRMGSEIARQRQAGFTYALLSAWPINAQNAPRTHAEKIGLGRVADSKQPYSGDEVLGGERYFTAIYPDIAVVEACVTCHNAHRDSPRHDYRLGDTMGGVVIRIPVK